MPVNSTRHTDIVTAHMAAESTRGQKVGAGRASFSFWWRTDGAARLPMGLAPVTSGLAAHGPTFPVPLLGHMLRLYEQAFLFRQHRPCARAGTTSTRP